MLIDKTKTLLQHDIQKLLHYYKERKNEQQQKDNDKNNNNSNCNKDRKLGILVRREILPTIYQALVVLNLLLLLLLLLSKDINSEKSAIGEVKEHRLEDLLASF